jgi:hypothetical protein
MFSLLGAFTHIFKSSRYLMALLWRPKTDPMAIWELQNRDLSPIMNKAYKQESRRDIFLLAIIAMMAGSVFLLPNSITRDTRFQAMLEKGQISTLDAQASIWVIQAEPYVYPVTNAIRKYILIGFEF